MAEFCRSVESKKKKYIEQQIKQDAVGEISKMRKKMKMGK